MGLAENVVLALMDAVQAARARGVRPEALADARAIHRKAQWRLDFIAAENSKGFHATQEAAGIRGEAIDFAGVGRPSPYTAGRQGRSDAMSPRLGPRAVRGLVAAGAAVAAYTVLVRPRYLRWGATDDEVTRPLPGDDLATDSPVGSTSAVTIAAPVEDVWPWLVQIGYGRGGFYSYDWLENAFVGLLLRGTPGYRSAETILPEHQRLSPGDFIPSGPPDMMGGRLADVARWKVLAVEPNRALVLEGWSAFVLEPLGDRATRLIVRSRGPGVWGRLAHYLFWEPAHFVMERRMLLGIKQRAERRARDRRTAGPSA